MISYGHNLLKEQEVLFCRNSFKRKGRKDWGVVPKGPGYTFSYKVTREFFYRNNLKMLFRGHEIVEKVSQLFFSQYLFLFLGLLFIAQWVGGNDMFSS